MTLSRIIELLPVPPNASEQGGGDWGALPEDFGGRFPEAYVDFVSTYGTGSIGGFLWVLNPFSQNPSLSLDQARYFRDAYQSLRDDFPQYYLRNADDFLPWAFTDNGDAIVWITNEDNPNEWSVCIQSSDPAQEEM
ncbi:MAG: SMI1/KNR4 family protein, partial [Pseudomonadota bacterium]